MNKYFPILIIFLCFSLAPIANAESVPSWIKNTAGWWATDLISESEFIAAIEYLVNVGIIVVQNDANSTSKSESVPSWIKNTAGWWSQNSISDGEFIDSISFLINNGIISLESNCNPIVDKNRNQIPDEIEKSLPWDALIAKIQKQTVIENRDWSNCKMPKELSFHKFQNINFSNTDFSNTNLFNSHFYDVTFVGTNFSNAKLYGTVFINSLLDNVNFSNTDFSPNAYESPFVYYSLYVDDIKMSCNFTPCNIVTFSSAQPSQDPMESLIFGQNNMPINLKQEKIISDLSDLRIIYRLVPSFLNNEMKNINFNNSDLSYAMFGMNKITNVDFSKSDMSQSQFFFSDFERVKFIDESFDEKKSIKLLKNNEQKSYPEASIPHQKFGKNIEFSDIVFTHSIENPPINWSMGMTLYDKKLFVANTDDHSIEVYERDNFELIQSFTSPLQNECETTNTFTKITDCDTTLRNLPTSLAILDEKIFVSYGFQNDIQIFDLNGNFIKKFGQTGDGQGEFIGMSDIVSNDNELFALDSGNQRIQVFDNDGVFLREFPITEKFLDSEKMDVSIYEDELFVMISSESSVKKFTLDGRLIDTIHMPEIKPNSLSSLSVENNLLLFADSSSSKSFIYDLNGELILSFGNFGKFYGEFNSPQDIIFDGKKIFVSDAYNYRIQIFELIR